MIGRRKYRWLVPALVALLAFVGGLTGNLVTVGMDSFVGQYRPWLWGVTGLAGLVAVAVAIWDARHPEATETAVMVRHATLVDGLRQRYLTRIAQRIRYLPLRGVDFKTASAETEEQERLLLSDVYVALDTNSPDPAAQKAEKTGEENRKMLSALEAVALHRRMVLLGGPGSGKSTFLNHLTFCLANESLDPRARWADRLPEWPSDWADLLPVPIILRDVAAWFQRIQPAQRQAGLFQAYLAFWLTELGLNDCTELIETQLREGRALLLLDGMDEVAIQDDTLARIKEMIADLPHAYPDTPMVVTCRVLSYEDSRWRLPQSAWPTVELAELDSAKIDRFVKVWYDQLAAMSVVTNAPEKSNRLSQAVRRPDLWRMAGNPLLLTVMALVHTHKGELPDARALLYEDVVDLLLWRWEAIKLESEDGRETTWRQLLQEAELSDIDMKRVLWELAFDVHGQLATPETEATENAQEITADIPEATLLNRVRELHPTRNLDWADRMVQIMKLRAGLLVEGRPQVYHFPHRTFQEHLAGSHLSNLPDFAGEALDLAAQGAYWWEAILLAVGRLVHVSGDIDRPLMLVNELCPHAATLPAAPDGWRKSWLAGACLLEIGRVRAVRRKLGLGVTDRVPHVLAALVAQGHLSPRERAEAGSVLAALGDPRNLDEMVPIPAGDFLMGSDKDKDSLSYGDETPQHRLHVDAFRMAKYAVTNGQYARFVLAANHAPPSHWHGAAPPPELLNHPVVNVTWHDAQAYCAWLSKERGEGVRLPSEAEWEKAARGTDGRIYPWGNEAPDENRCNFGNTVGDTSPVGMYPLGVSLYGCLDMAGNVWEWTSSLWGEDWQKPQYGYPYDSGDGRESLNAPDDIRRVLRGGSFVSRVQVVRCACRSHDPPYDRSRSVGFRVVSPGL